MLTKNFASYALFAQLIACGGGDSGAICDTTTTNSTCYDYTDSGMSADAVAALCNPGQVGDAPCPSTSRVGRCQVAVLGQTVSFYSTGGNPYDNATASDTCRDLGGTFTAE